MLDAHLAHLYEVETRALKQAVKRNPTRFPTDFMFGLTESEVEHLVSQTVIPSKSYLGGALPYAFTEQGVAMLSSVLRSAKAIEVNIAIIRAFVVLRQHLADYKELREQILVLEQNMSTKFSDIYQALDYLLAPKNQRRSIGFNPPTDDNDGNEPEV